MARYRMIKPEFWEDDKIAECSANARLLFIALWNFADDEGYLEYRQKWLKAKCLPYDNVKIVDLIDELLKVERIEIRGGIIWIKNFLKHQRIDKPQESNLSQKFNNSQNDPGTIQEYSEIVPSINKDKLSKDKLNKDKVAFESFWKKYPRKENKASAWKSFQKIGVELYDLIMARLDEQKKSVQWKEIQYVPHASTWLNQKRWEDETVKPKPKPGSPEYYLTPQTV